MKNITGNINTNNYSLRQIPEHYSNQKTENDEVFFFDKTKILEFSNSLDEWEINILFGENGFYSVKGKDVEKKQKEYLSELENFVSKKYSELNLSSPDTKEIFSQIKQEKLNAIKEQMQLHTDKELQDWQLNVFENALELNKQKAVLYKNNQNIVDISLKNGLTILKLMSEQEKWKDEILRFNYKKYKSEFYSGIISAFILDKDIKACIYYEKYKEFLDKTVQTDLENAVKDLKVNIIGYNWAKELFSYNLPEDEQEKEFTKIKDELIRKSARAYIKIFNDIKKQQEENDYKLKNSDNWQKIVSNIKNNTSCYFLDIDFSLKEKDIKRKKEYIKKIIAGSYITSDEDEYLKLFDELTKDIQKFKKSDISDYICCLSEEDFNFFFELQQDKNNTIMLAAADYFYILNLLKKYKVTSKEDKYKLFKLYFTAIKDYETTNKKIADLSTRNNILNDIKDRYV